MKKICLVFALFICFVGLYGQEVRVLTYNIHHGNPPSEPSKIDLESIAAVIKESDPDIVGIQEVDVRVSRSQMLDQAKEFAGLTGMSYFFSKGIDLEQGEYGTVILTKHKIVGNRRYNLPMVVESENRSLAIVDVELPGGKVVSFANTHLDLKKENQIAQAKYINELGDWYDRPLILAGDLNSNPDKEPIKILENYFQRNTTHNEATYPSNGSEDEIDYIMVGKHSKFSWKSYKVLEEYRASDHFPVLAEIVFE